VPSTPSTVLFPSSKVPYPSPETGIEKTDAGVYRPVDRKPRYGPEGIPTKAHILWLFFLFYITNL
jgi:hypothetical protein